MKELKEGSVVLMSAKSNLQGYGNPQCVESVCEPLGEISLYGHNQHYKIHHVSKIFESPENPLICKLEELIVKINTHNSTPSKTHKTYCELFTSDIQKLIDEARGND